MHAIRLATSDTLSVFDFIFHFCVFFPGFWKGFQTETVKRRVARYARRKSTIFADMCVVA